jgi:transcriptional regulator with XRE-family HTH domain
MAAEPNGRASPWSAAPASTRSNYRSFMADDTPLLRNRSGVARERPVDRSVEELALEQLIAANVRMLRLQRGLSIGELADEIGISKAMLSKIENAQTSCSLTMLARLSTGFDVPVTALFRGADAERQASFVRSGRGTPITRDGTQVGHEYLLLGTLRGEHRRLECLMVTLTAKSEVYPLFQHPGTEFIYMLEGVMDYGHSRSVYRMTPGDSLQLDGEGVHGPVELVETPIRFLSVIAFPDRTL